MKTKLLSALSALLMMAMTSCNGNGGTNVVDGGHGIGIDTATVNAIIVEALYFPLRKMLSKR